MKLDHFLLFWSRHNITIIEVLIGLILLMIVYLAFRAFFGADAETEAGNSGTGLSSAEIEKTLQKILEAQGARAGGGAGATVVAAGEGAAGASEEVEKLKADIQLKEKLLAEAKEEVAKASAGGAAVDPKLMAGLEGKVKDLEARLSEYEIISEDIADLSFYKEENAKLQRELEALKAGGKPALAAAPEPVAPAPTPAPEPVAVAVAPEPPTAEPPASEPAAAAPAEPAATPEPVAAAPAALAVDDDLMKEFAAAVEGQKASGTTETPEAPPASVTGDNAQLLNQFENFVKKD